MIAQVAVNHDIGSFSRGAVSLRGDAEAEIRAGDHLLLSFQDLHDSDRRSCASAFLAGRKSSDAG